MKVQFQELSDTTLMRELVRLALAEDLQFGDITSELSIEASFQGKAAIVARERLVVCAGALCGMIFEELGVEAEVEQLLPDGTWAAPETPFINIKSDARSLLSAERTILNFLQRAAGVATFTRTIVEKASPLKVLDTRKTMPGWRTLDKYATRVGGAFNHRMSLSDMILVKNNHVDAHPGGMREVLSKICSRKPMYAAVEVEVRDEAELKIALEFSPEIIMLDNFSDQQIASAMNIVASASKRPLIEVSGGVREERFEALKKLNVDAVSIGALTTQARNVDISMRLKLTA